MDKVNSVAELIQRCEERGMPLEKMRFFINEDRKEPRCFGIYQDERTQEWVVYKNKSDGSRAIRYWGPDEGYAANELWQKINSEIELRRGRAARAKPYNPWPNRILIGIVVVALGFFLYKGLTEPKRGYYVVDNDVYYYQDDYWYYYALGDWLLYDAPEGDEWYDDAYYGETYPFEDAGDAFEQSSYYVEPSQDDDDSDSSIFDSWDSFDTDWDSDW